MRIVRSAQVARPGGSFAVVEHQQSEPPRGHVRVAVEACGICRSDEGFVDDVFPGVSFPLVPGHEIAGRIDAAGDDAGGWSVGDRVAVGWFGGCCLVCQYCREGDFIHCVRLQVPGLAYPGGYSESIVVPTTALARIPTALSAVDAAPMGCAGVTTFNALRRSPARPGDVVAVLGIGGLGHLGVRFAVALGFETVAIARGAHKADEAKQLGAHHYIDNTAGDVAQQLLALGGVMVVLATVGNSEAMGATIEGLRPRGELVAIGATPEPIPVSPLQLIMSSKSVHGHPSGTAREVEETMRFAELAGVRAMIETRPLAEADAAYQRMLSGQARYRMVLTTGT